MDALPITEETHLPYASEHPGLMHACGHDGHTAILLGVAAVLKNQDFSGKVKLLFQPAEEGGCGAQRLCQDGALENPPVQAIFGLHGWPALKVGTVATKSGPLLASVDGFALRITGRGGHAAAPHETLDPIVCAAAIVQGLQNIVSREGDPTDACVVTVSQINAGTAFNVIPDHAELHGTIRALTRKRREAAIASLERISRGIATAYRCQVAFDYYGTTPVTSNTAELAAFVRETAQRTLGNRAYVEVPKPTMWGEDFAFYIEQIPGCFFLLGVQPHERDSYPMLHNPQYDFTDAAVPVGIKMMVELALGYLNKNA
jgi:amidohydrolase